LDAFQAVLDEFRTVLKTGDEEAVMRFFEEARRIRQAHLRLLK